MSSEHSYRLGAFAGFIASSKRGRLAGKLNSSCCNNYPSRVRPDTDVLSTLVQSLSALTRNPKPPWDPSLPRAFFMRCGYPAALNAGTPETSRVPPGNLAGTPETSRTDKLSRTEKLMACQAQRRSGVSNGAPRGRHPWLAANPLGHSKKPLVARAQRTIQLLAARAYRLSTSSQPTRSNLSSVAE